MFRSPVDRVFFCPVDIPFFLEETLRLELTRTEKIVLPICHNRLGHPILFDAELIPEILDYQGGNGLKGGAGFNRIRGDMLPSGCG